jgi:hypothetical protein
MHSIEARQLHPQLVLALPPRRSMMMQPGIIDISAR